MDLPLAGLPPPLADPSPLIPARPPQADGVAGVRAAMARDRVKEGRTARRASASSCFGQRPSNVGGH
eukprot:3065175-Alexandrium_andersonii.AAC.1